MSSILLRTLTRKSRFGVWNRFGTVQNELDCGGKRQLAAAYFKLTTINYVEDVLNELGITSEWRIEKPGANKELYYKFLKANGWSKELTSTKRRGGAADKLLKLNVGLSKSWLQSKNHGR